MYSYGPPHMAEQKQDNQLKHTFSSYVRIRNVALKTCQRQWTIGKSGERGSGISVLTARHDDDDNWPWQNSLAITERHAATSFTHGSTSLMVSHMSNPLQWHTHMVRDSTKLAAMTDLSRLHGRTHGYQPCGQRAIS